MTTISLTGGDRLQAKLDELAAKLSRGGTLRVGFLEGQTYNNGQSVATVAVINNFGAPAAGIPARPFFTNWIKKYSETWGRGLEAQLKRFDYDLHAAFTVTGAVMVGQLQQEITDTNSPANSPVTDLLKQRFPMHDGMTFDDVQKARDDVAAGETAPAGKPLVWSGVMRQSVNFEIDLG